MGTESENTLKIGVLGTGMVGRAIGARLVAKGHQVTMGARTAGNIAAQDWAAETGAGASAGTFAEAAAGADLVFLCVKGEHALAVVEAAGLAAGQVLVDITNPLDFSQGFPPTLSVCNTDSLGEQIQRAVPGVHVVKSLNTLTAALMLDPGQLPEPTAVFVSGNDAGAKATVTALLQSFGWEQVIDLGDITTARGTESWLPLWVRLYGAQQSAMFNLRIVKKG